LWSLGLVLLELTRLELMRARDPPLDLSVLAKKSPTGFRTLLTTLTEEIKDTFYRKLVSELLDLDPTKRPIAREVFVRVHEREPPEQMWTRRHRPSAIFCAVSAVKQGWHPRTRHAAPSPPRDLPELLRHAHADAEAVEFFTSQQGAQLREFYLLSDGLVLIDDDEDSPFRCWGLASARQFLLQSCDFESTLDYIDWATSFDENELPFTLAEAATWLPLSFSEIDISEDTSELELKQLYVNPRTGQVIFIEYSCIASCTNLHGGIIKQLFSGLAECLFYFAINR